MGKYKIWFAIGLILVIFYNFIYNHSFLEKTSILVLGIILSLYGAAGLLINDFKNNK
jgi:hypothetical protein